MSQNEESRARTIDEEQSDEEYSDKPCLTNFVTI
jgi:hypothetical protein